MAVHPRVRGEHFLPIELENVAAGSSPRARGTLWRFLLLASYPRFIPACAGNTIYPLFYAVDSAVHPRVRGEHRWVVVWTIVTAGSSPRARGTLSHTRTDRADHRFIPACAGNTFGSCLTCAGRSVHPRVRGEHFLPIELTVLNSGSSPRARGTLFLELIDFNRLFYCQNSTASNALIISPFSALAKAVMQCLKTRIFSGNGLSSTAP